MIGNRTGEIVDHFPQGPDQRSKVVHADQTKR